MLLVIPYSRRAHALYKYIFDLGGVARHDVLLVGPNSRVGEMEEALNVLKGAFDHADIFTKDHECPSMNKLFVDTACFLDQIGCNHPWYWCDATCTPLRATWLTEIAAEYGRNKAAFLGPREESVEVSPATGKAENEPDRLAACSVFPGDLYQRSQLIRQLSHAPGGATWNVDLRFEMRRAGRFSTIMQHKPGTKSYFNDGAGLRFSERAGTSPSPQVQAETVVISGVTDGSVLDSCISKPKKTK
jgi:hypothetical protein